MAVMLLTNKARVLGLGDVHQGVVWAVVPLMHFIFAVRVAMVPDYGSAGALGFRVSRVLGY